MYLKYGNELLKKKVTPPEIMIKKFSQKFTFWLILGAILPKLSVLFLPEDLEPAGYLKIGLIFKACFIIACNMLRVSIELYPTNFFLKNNGACILSQLESISILIAATYILLLIGVVSYNTINKIVKRNKFFKVFLKNLRVESSRLQSNGNKKLRSRVVPLEERKQENEELDRIKQENKFNDAFGSVVEMGMMSENNDFYDMIENMVYE